jgi:Extensin-like protein C-terminus
MAWGVRWYLVGSVVLGLLGVLAGCSGGGMFAEREPWRREAEVHCLESGAVKEGAGIVRIKAIRGAGVCGADFPLRVSSLGESALLSFADDLRPPATIPGINPLPYPPLRAGEGREGGSRSPTGRPVDPPIRQQNLPPLGGPHGLPSSLSSPSRAVPPRSVPAGSRHHGSVAPEQPTSLNAPGAADHGGGAPEVHDFRRPYGASAPRRDPYDSSPREDFSPEPYERRRLVDPSGPPRGPVLVGKPRFSTHANMPPEIARRGEPAVVPLGPSRAPQVTGSVAPVAVSPPATLACPMVSELERWLATSVQPAAMRWFGSPVAEIKQISAYSCRGMNGNPRARISEHAFGNALDIASFTLADGRTITVKGGWAGLPEEQGFLRDIQGAACDQFTTVLAPGSNVYHYDHIHVDLMRRYSGHRACNPRAVSGEEVAARAAGVRYAGRRSGEASVTGTLAPSAAVSQPRRPPPTRLRSDPDEDHRFPALPLAEPGNDGLEED